MGKVYYRVLVAVAMAMAALHVSAQELMVATDRPGELEEKVGAVADGISSLSVEGLIDYSDIDYLRALATGKSLERINISQAVVSSGKATAFPTFASWPDTETICRGIGQMPMSEVDSREKQLGSKRMQDIEAIYEGILSYYNSSIMFYETTDPQNPYRYYLVDIETKAVKLASLLFRPLTYAIYPIADSYDWGLNKNFEELAAANGWKAFESDGDVFVFNKEGMPVQLEVTAWRHSDDNVYAQMKFLPKAEDVAYDLQSPDLDAFGEAEPAAHIKAYEEGLGNTVETYGETSALGESFVVRFGDGTHVSRKYQLAKGDYSLMSIVEEFEKDKEGILSPDNTSFRKFLSDNGFEDSDSESNVYYNKAREIRLEVRSADDNNGRYATMTFTSTRLSTSGYTMPLLNFEASVRDVLVYEGRRGSKREEGSSLGTYVFTFTGKSEFARAVYEFVGDRLTVVRQFASSKDILLTGEFAAMLRDAGFEQVSSDMFATVYRDKAGKVALTVFTDSGLMEFKKNKDDGPGTGGGQVFEKDENGYFLPLLCFNVDDPMTAINAYEESAGHKVSEWMDNMFTVDKAEPKRPLVDIVYVLTDDKSMLREVIVGCSADNFSKGDFEQFMASKGFEAIGGADGIFVEQRYYNKELKVLAQVDISIGRRIIFSYNEAPETGE